MLLTRGKLVGDLVDAFTELSNSIEVRNKLGLTDLTTYVENFVRDVLNLVYALKLVNTNSSTANFAAIDLIDKKSKTAFQITSTKTLDKVKETLRVFEDNKLYSDCDTLFIFVASKKQKTYTEKDITRTSVDNQYTFDPKQNIIDWFDVCQKTIAMDLEPLTNLHTLVLKNINKVRAEFELPDEIGEYNTSFLKYAEKTKPEWSGSCQHFITWAKKNGLNRLSHEDLIELVEEHYKRLASLPRISRELYSYMFDRMEGVEVNYNRLKRLIPNIDMDEELLLLRDVGLIDDYLSMGYSKYEAIYVNLTFSDTDFFENFSNFIKDRNFDTIQLFVDLDYSLFT